MGFFSRIPWWVYVIVMVVGLVLAILFFILFARARRRAAVPPPPGMPAPGRGTGFLVGAILSLVLLLVTPLVIMLIAQPWSSRSSRSGDRYERGYDDEDDQDDRGSNRSSLDDEDEGDTAWVEGRWGDAPDCRVTIDFRSGGTGTAVEHGESMPMTWRSDGDRVIATVENDSATISRAGSDAISIEVDGETRRFERCD